MTLPPHTVPAAEIDRRIHAIQREIQAAGIEAIFVVQRVDLYYFSGTAQYGFLFIPAEGPPLLLVKRSVERARRESPLAHLVPFASVKEVPGLVAEFHGRRPKGLGMELDVLPVNDFRFYSGLFGLEDVADASPHILHVRRLKSPWEIAQLEATAEMTRRTFAHMAAIIAPGLTEMEFAGMFEAYSRTLGHAGRLRVRHPQTEGYPWHVLSGASGGMVGLLDSPASGQGTSPAFPVGAGSRRLAREEPIMVDLGSAMNGYHLDETRMFAIGSMPAKALSASRAAIEIHDAVLERARPGAALGDLYDHAWELARAKGLAGAFLGPDGHKTAFIGHGIGLELIEPPIIARGRDTVLEPGMVFALEPKLVYAGEFAAGVESVFAVSETGSRLISRVPVDVFLC
jgi:Xaa-Pro aminopeptidase